MTTSLHLEPCPFCGEALQVMQRKFNPYARCVTEGCMGARLPLLNLDMPEDIEKWNTRVEPEAPAALAALLVRNLSQLRHSPLPWSHAIEITAVITNMPPEEKARLLALGDSADAQ